MIKFFRISKDFAFRLLLGSLFIFSVVILNGCSETDDHTFPMEDSATTVDVKQSVQSIQLHSKEADLFIQELEDFSERIVVRNGLLHINERHVRNDDKEWRWDAEFRAALQERNKLIQQKKNNVDAVLSNQWEYLDKDTEYTSCPNKDSRTGDSSDRPWVQHYWWGSRHYIPHNEYSLALYSATIIGSGICLVSFGLGYFVVATAGYLQWSYSMYGYSSGAILYVFGSHSGLPFVFYIEYPRSGTPPEEPVKELPPNDDKYDYEDQER